MVVIQNIISRVNQQRPLILVVLLEGIFKHVSCWISKEKPLLSFYLSLILLVHLHAVRQCLKNSKDFTKTKDDLKSLQSVGQIIGVVLQPHDNECCKWKTISFVFSTVFQYVVFWNGHFSH
jgi:hypothetical protein